MKKITFLIYTFALIIRLIISVPFLHDWDGFVFSQSAFNLLQGETPYQTVLKNDPEIYPDSDRPQSEQWYAYPPLPLLMFTLPVGVCQSLCVNVRFHNLFKLQTSLQSEWQVG